MIELFRYIEQSFVPAAKKDDSVNLEGDSDFQNRIRRKRNEPSAAEKIRSEAEEFISSHFPQSPETPIKLKKQLLQFHHDLRHLKNADLTDIDSLVLNVFDKTAQELAQGDTFLKDKTLLNDSIIAIKLTTGFDKVNASELVAMRQAIAFVEQIAEGSLPEITAENIKSSLLRPMKVPLSLFPPKSQSRPSDLRSAEGDREESTKIEVLRKEARALEATYETLMSFHAYELELIPLEHRTASALIGTTTSVHSTHADQASALATSSPPSILTLSQTSLNKLRRCEKIKFLGIFDFSHPIF